MQLKKNAFVRILSFALAVLMMSSIIPISAHANIDEPISAETGSGWEHVGDEQSGNSTDEWYSEQETIETAEPTEATEGSLDAEDLTPTDDSDTFPGDIATPSTTQPLGASAIIEENPAPWIQEYQEWAKMQMMKRTAADVSMIVWGQDQSSDRIVFANGAFINSPMPRIFINDDTAFCGEWNGLTPSGDYDPIGNGSDTVIKQYLANFDNSTKTDAYYSATQALIWARLMGTTIVSWGTCPGAAVYPEIQNGTHDYSNVKYDYIEWGGGTQKLFSYNNETLPDTPQLKILKKNEDGSKVVSGATFQVTGPGGYNQSFTTDTKGIITANDLIIGEYTVTETSPPAGYELSSPNTQTVTLTAETPTATVEFRNPKTTGGGGGSGTHIEVETEITTTSEVRQRTTYSYSDAIGQVTIRKHDQDGRSLDGALFDIDVRFTDGSHVSVNNWEVDNGARLFTWTHPQDNHDPAIVTITEVQPPRYYAGDPTPKTVVVYPTYTRVTHVETWTVTITTENTSATVIDIETDEVLAQSSSTSTAETTSDPQVQEYADFIEGDRETTVTFVNTRITGDIEVIKKDANTGLPLAGASIHLWGDDLGEASTIDRTLVTGPDGIAYFDNLPPGTYVIQETQAPFGYNLNDELQTAVLQSGQVLRKEVRNYRKDGLIIKKVDPDGNPIAGAVFELRRGSGEVLLSEVTNENGIIYRGFLTEGLYVIEEKKAPEGYLLDENPIKEIFIYESDDNKEYTVTFVNKKKPAIEITKVDGVNPLLALPGAVFRITNTLTNQYWDVTTGDNGVALLEGLEINETYIVEEIQAPPGYVNSGYRQEIVLRESRVHTLSVSNFQKPALNIIKKDKVTGATLEGATFRVSWNNGADYRDVTTKSDGSAVITDLQEGWYSIVEIKAPQGYLINSTPTQILLESGKTSVVEIFNEAKPSLSIIKVDSVTKTPLQYAKFRVEKKYEGATQLIGEFVSDENGLVYLENINPGRYEITEIVAPDGYNIDNTTHEVTISFGQAYTIEFPNTPKSPIFILKVDEKGNPLAGAKFKVTAMNGSMIGTVTSSTTGYAIVPYVDPGFYVVEEVQAPDGYILSSTPVNVEVKSGKPAQVEFVNYQKPSLQIMKMDSVTQRPLVGAKFKITTTAGTFVGEYTTGIDGLITVEGLDKGSYVVTEIRSPDGYILDVTPQVVALDPGKAVRLDFYNSAKPGLQLTKLDSVTGLPVAGAMFSVVELQSGSKKDHGSFTTGANGTLFIPELTPGHYTITEIKAADGYILDPTPKNIYVEGGKLNTVEFYNTPYSDLRLLKIDSETREPLANAIFKLFDAKRLEIGTYTTSALGEIYVTGLPSGTYFIQEVKAPAGYVLDNTVRQIDLIGGKTTTVEVKNTALGTLRILKVDADEKKPLYGATFLLYDSKDNLLGEFTTDQNGLIVFGRNLQAGKYKLKEIKAPEGYIINDTIHTVTVKEGSTTEIEIKNTLATGNIQIVKVSSDKNSITKDKEGAPLSGAVFEIYNEQLVLVDKITTDKNGIATSKNIPLGKYVIKEVKAPQYYLTDGKPFYAEIKVHGDLIRFRIENTPEDLEVTVEKRGVVETAPGEVVRYDFADISNKSNTALSEFYWKDELPSDAVRIQSLNTGTWSERLTYAVWVKTNIKGWRCIRSNLSTKTEYTIDLRPNALGLASNEYVTAFKFEFGTVEAGFHSTKDPFVNVRVNNGLPQGYRFTNKTDVGGKSRNEWVYTHDSWTTVIFKPKTKLPKTGF